MSFGGADTGEPGFASTQIAQEKANMIWAAFGPNTGDASIPRPFGNAAVDGFDFNYERPIQNLAAFAQQLQKNADASGKHSVFSAAPQCPFPDDNVGDIMGGGPWSLADQISLDLVYVQFYNNEICGTNNFGTNTAAFNFASWDNWAKTVSKNPNVKFSWEFLAILVHLGLVMYQFRLFKA